MRILLQRASAGSVSVDDAIVGEIDHGLVTLIGIGPADTPAIVERMSTKVIDMRIFEDAEGKMNRSLRDMCAAPGSRAGMLVVSQFTLYADVRKGRRPSFTNAASPDLAQRLVDHFSEQVRAHGIPVATGQFGAHMVVRLANDGPVTIWIDSADLTRE